MAPVSSSPRRSTLAKSAVAALALSLVPHLAASRSLAASVASTPCYIPSQYFPKQKCSKITSKTKCNRGYNVFETRDECCADDGTGAFPDGCTTDEALTTECWYAIEFYPEQACGPTTDATICGRGWGVYKDEDVCCAEGAAFSPGCSIAYADAQAIAPAPGPSAEVDEGNYDEDLYEDEENELFQSSPEEVSPAAPSPSPAAAAPSPSPAPEASPSPSPSPSPIFSFVSPSSDESSIFQPLSPDSVAQILDSPDAVVASPSPVASPDAEEESPFAPIDASLVTNATETSRDFSPVV